MHERSVWLDALVYLSAAVVFVPVSVGYLIPKCQRKPIVVSFSDLISLSLGEPVVITFSFIEPIPKPICYLKSISIHFAIVEPVVITFGISFWCSIFHRYFLSMKQEFNHQTGLKGGILAMQLQQLRQEVD